MGFQLPTSTGEFTGFQPSTVGSPNIPTALEDEFIAFGGLALAYFQSRKALLVSGSVLEDGLITQWIFQVPVKGGRDYIIPQLAVYTTYIPLIYCLLGGYIIPTTLYRNLKNPLNYLEDHPT